MLSRQAHFEVSSVEHMAVLGIRPVSFGYMWSLFLKYCTHYNIYKLHILYLDKDQPGGLSYTFAGDAEVRAACVAVFTIIGQIGLAPPPATPLKDRRLWIMNE